MLEVFEKAPLKEPSMLSSPKYKMSEIVTWFSKTFGSHWKIDPHPILLYLPKSKLGITWYGFLFSTGLIISYTLFGKVVEEDRQRRGANAPSKQSISTWRDQLFTWVFVGVIGGARLGEVLFYDPQYYARHLREIPQIWQGGLSSHGALIGILVAVWGFCRARAANSAFPTWQFSYLALLDRIAIVLCPSLCLIRVGNFINQEILGTFTQLPWGITFLTPKDGSIPLPRHPVQLYEAVCYLFIGVALWTNRKALLAQRSGLATGIFLLCALSARALIETFKAPIGMLFWPVTLHTGQALSLPGIALGAVLIIQSFLAKKRTVPPKC